MVFVLFSFVFNIQILTWTYTVGSYETVCGVFQLCAGIPVEGIWSALYPTPALVKKVIPDITAT